MRRSRSMVRVAISISRSLHNVRWGQGEICETVLALDGNAVPFDTEAFKVHPACPKMGGVVRLGGEQVRVIGWGEGGNIRVKDTLLDGNIGEAQERTLSISEFLQRLGRSDLARTAATFVAPRAPRHALVAILLKASPPWTQW